MRLLAIETSGARGGIALVEDGHVVATRALDENMRHARDLVPAMDSACKQAGWDPRAVDVVAVSIGPGSFTGVRIAVVTAKTIAWDTGAKVVAAPSLRALAHNAPADAGRIACILDAKRGGLFASVFERRGAEALWLDGLEETFGPAVIEPEDLARRLQKPALVLGHGLPKAQAALAGFELSPAPLWDIRIEETARLGWEMAQRGEFADPLRLQPVYIRLPEAQEIWERRHGQQA